MQNFPQSKEKEADRQSQESTRTGSWEEDHGGLWWGHSFNLKTPRRYTCLPERVRKKYISSSCKPLDITIKVARTRGGL